MFTSMVLLPEGKVVATAKGHPDEVVRAFREVCQLVLGGSGPWRITKVLGECSDGVVLDSEMEWTLEAKRKSATRGRLVL